MKLEKLHEVDIRKVWPHEQYDFSKWLAAEENIQELGNVLNLSLTDIETERLVGSYRCDILCRDEITGKVVLIENQLEQTNHDHLGKILTYASGLDASVVVERIAALLYLELVVTVGIRGLHHVNSNSFGCIIDKFAGYVHEHFCSKVIQITA